jgi:hypothetical protein
MTQENLARAFATLATRDGATAPGDDLQTALQHVNAALNVFDPKHMSHDYQTATKLRNKIIAALAPLEHPPHRTPR